MQTQSVTKRQSVRAAASRPAQSSSDKQVTLRTLSVLKRQVYSRAAIAMQQQPAKAAYIQKRADSDAQHIAFVINMVSVKL